ncbi:hypothetical protein BD324DRAFT_458985 [Kockovaella imperatae]|uniref:DUF7729 domain-containing protein n=1 Tax=Kockovaella imperatae TaxID=4999 RepID=A0A1Y1UF59_9TREE|nr:hypothetical protein BD324DRAFT_458985 [Kockovaella imperatae]ORX36652.1 hypothetical protein BD324DRAFT_458985 [Kockovaella imperatae]
MRCPGKRRNASSNHVHELTAPCSSCTSELALLALTGPISECLQLTSLLPVISGSGSVIPSLNSYLSSICSSSTPRCSSSALQYANGNLTNSCSSDLSGGGNDATEIEALQQLLMHYDNVYDAGCAKNSTENQYCLTSTLYQVQNSTGQQITTSFLTSLLAGSGDGLSQIEQTFSSGRLCTGCVKTIYEQAVDANSSIANSAIAKDLSNTCGSSFIDCMFSIHPARCGSG